MGCLSGFVQLPILGESKCKFKLWGISLMIVQCLGRSYKYNDPWDGSKVPWYPQFTISSRGLWASSSIPNSKSIWNGSPHPCLTRTLVNNASYWLAPRAPITACSNRLGTGSITPRHKLATRSDLGRYVQLISVSPTKTPQEAVRAWSPTKTRWWFPIYFIFTPT